MMTREEEIHNQKHSADLIVSHEEILRVLQQKIYSNIFFLRRNSIIQPVNSATIRGSLIG